MAERTEELRRDIEDTRDRMSGTLDAIGDRVSPGRVVERRVAGVRDVATRARHQIMGAPRQVRATAGSGASSLGDAASSAGDRLSSVASGVGDQVTAAPDRIAEGTQGNPLAAGALAFGLGLLVGSLAPPSKAERDVAEQALPVIQDEARAIGQSVAATVKDDAQQAVEQTKQAATEAVEEVKGQADDARSTVQDQAADAKDAVQGRAADAKDTVQDEATDAVDDARS